jgi:hypothetical protein
MSSYNYGMDFGYDQIMSSSVDELTCYYNEPQKKKNIDDKLLINRLKQVEKKESLQNYLENSVMSDIKSNLSHNSCDCHKNVKTNMKTDIKSDLESFKKTLDELQRKNDMLTIFIIFLVIFVVMQFNSSSKYIIPISGLQRGEPLGQSIVAL